MENIIKEKNIDDYPKIISLKSTEKIVEQMKNNVCKINLKNGIKGTGFFCKIPFPDNNNLLPVLITNNHIINEKILKEEKKIIIVINNEQKEIKIENRIKYTNKEYDTTIIEIKEKKDEIYNYMELDENIIINKSNIPYINESIYIIQYPGNNKVSVSYGIIKRIEEINEYTLLHLCSTDNGSSGSPIINTLNNKVIGIHKEAVKYNYNRGTFLNYPIHDFINQYCYNSRNLNNNPLNYKDININNSNQNDSINDQLSLVAVKSKIIYDEIYDKHLSINDIIDNLPSDLIEALKEDHIVINTFNEISVSISRAIDDAKKEELIKPLKTQINFRVPESLKNKNNESSKNIKKELLFYKNAYEFEAAYINKIIEQAYILNNQLKPLEIIKKALKEYSENYKKNIQNLNIPYNNKKKGIDSIEKKYINEEEKKELKKCISEIDKKMNSYKEQAVVFFKETSDVNKQIIEEITTFINSFKELKNLVLNLRKEVDYGFTTFVKSSPEFENLDDSEKIKNVMKKIMDPLIKITNLISENKIKLKETKISGDKKNEKDTCIAKKMMINYKELKNRAKSIADKINETRLKINLNEMKLPELDIQELNAEEIKKIINYYKDEIEKINKKNLYLQEEFKKNYKFYK